LVDFDNEFDTVDFLQNAVRIDPTKAFEKHYYPYKQGVGDSSHTVLYTVRGTALILATNPIFIPIICSHSI